MLLVTTAQSSLSGLRYLFTFYIQVTLEQHGALKLRGSMYTWFFFTVYVLRVCVHACCGFSRVWLFVTPWTVAHQAPLSMGFSRQEYWSGLPCPPPGDLSDPAMEPESPIFPALQTDSLPVSPWASPMYYSTAQFMVDWILRCGTMDTEVPQ